MNGKKIAVFTLVGITFVCVGFSSGYLIGNFIYKPEPSIPPQEIVDQSTVTLNQEIEEPKTPEPTQEVVITHYLVKSEQNVLSIYEVSQGGSKLLKSYEVSIDMFPVEDQRQLEQGLEAPTKEAALEIAENFIS